MTQITDTTKVYSNDKQLWIGMTTKDAYKDKEVYNLFNFADRNCDRVIDENEMRRYNGPLLVVEKNDKRKQRFIGSVSGFRGSSPISGQIITSKEFEFYPGQKIEEINESDFNLAFRDLDLNSDGELSSEEIQEYQTYVQKKKEFAKNYERISTENYIMESKDEKRAVIGGIIGGIVGLLPSAAVLCKIDDALTHSKNIARAKYFKENGGLIFTLSLVAGDLAFCFAGGAIAYYLKHKKTIPPEKQLENEIAELKVLDEQYKNVYKK